LRHDRDAAQAQAGDGSIQLPESRLAFVDRDVSEPYEAIRVLLLELGVLVVDSLTIPERRIPPDRAGQHGEVQAGELHVPDLLLQIVDPVMNREFGHSALGEIDLLTAARSVLLGERRWDVMVLEIDDHGPCSPPLGVAAIILHPAIAPA